MNQVVIATHELGKRYRLGGRATLSTLRESVMSVLALPFRSRTRAIAVRAAGDAQAASREFWALKNLSIEVKAGEVVGIIGRNGAGKSTLLKILSRITEPTSGHARITGRVGSLLEVGTGFHPELTGRENIYLNGSILGMRRAEISRKFDEIVAFAEVERFLETAVKHYSSGMYTRLAFAVAAHLEPEILIIDEVLAVGDAEFQRKCMGKMSEVATEGRTVLFVSHNMSAILALCKRGVWLDRGECREDGPIGAVVQAYTHAALDHAHHDLSQIPGRVPKGRIQFTRYWLESPRGRAVEHATSGDEVHIVLEYQCAEPMVRNCRLGISVDSPFGQPLFVCTTDLTVRQEIRLSGRGTVTCTIPRFPLTSGQYALTLSLDSGHGSEDVVQSGARISVVDGDFFGTGRQAPLGWEGRCVIVPHGWTVDAPDATTQGTNGVHSNRAAQVDREEHGS